MNQGFKLFLLLLVVLGTFMGCRQPVSNPGQRQALFNFSPPNLFNRESTQLAQSDPMQVQTRNPEQFQAFSQLSSQLSELNQQVGAFDADNQELYTEIAGLKQKLQLANDYTQQLKQQLADTAGQIKQISIEKANIEQQFVATQQRMKQMSDQERFQNGQSLQQQQAFQNQREQFAQFGGGQVPSQLAGSATVRANNSLTSRLDEIRIPGGQARMDGDVIRVEIPTDTLFVPGSYDIQPAQAPLLQNLVTTIRQTFPRQIVGIEAHWDKTPLSPPGTTDHQLTATQALSVFDGMVRLGLSPEQLFTMAMGSNRPRHAVGMRGGVSPNRRIEIVIYPETFDGS